MDHSIQTIEEDEERIWDELHHHQNNELMRHYNNNNNNNHHNIRPQPQWWSPHPPPQQQHPSLFQQINQDLQRIRTIVTDAAYDAYYNHQNHQRHQILERHDGLLSPPSPLSHQNTHPTARNYRALHSGWQRWFWSPATWTTTYDLPSSPSSNHNTYLTEFGIPDLDDPHPQQYHRDPHHHHHHHHPSDPNQHHNHDYIHLSTDPRHFPSPEHDGWASIADLDVYFQSIYHYYYHRGWIPILTRGISEVITIYFTFIFSILVFVYIDWKQLALCIDEATCQANFLQHYIQRRPFRKHFWSLYNLWIILYIVIFGIYCMVTFVSFLHSIQIALRTKYIYEEKLGISARKLMNGAIDWDRDVVQKLITLQESGQYRIVIPNTTRTTNTMFPTNGNRPTTTIYNKDATTAAAETTTTTTNGDTASDSDTTDGPDDRPTSAATVPSSSNMNHPYQQQQHNISALMIANRILRKENFMIALFNRQILNLSILPQNHRSTIQHPSRHAPRFFCSSLEWSIYYCVLNFIFNHKYQIRPAFYLDPAALRRRFQICGIMHVVLMPFLLFFVTLYFGLRNVYDWKSTKQYLGPREWSISAKWIFREFNELPHFFERRLAPSYDAAETYVELFGSNEFIAALGRICVFIGGSLGALVLAFAAMNDAILLHVKIGDWNLLWYGGMFGILYSAGKAMIPKAIAQPKSARNLYAEMDTALAEVANHTHYYPEIWINRGWDFATYSAFSSMFQYKVRLFLNEIISMILAPYILYFSLADCSESICELVLSCRAEMPGVGDVCGFATFDFSIFQDDNIPITTTTPAVSIRTHTDEPMVAMGQSLSESILQTANVEASIRQFPKPKARYGKMQKSLATFQEAHPSWSHTSDGGSLLSNGGGERSRKNTSSALNSEQDLHRVAAARQLEVLERIEEGNSSAPEITEDLLLLPNIIDERYIPILNATPTVL